MILTLCLNPVLQKTLIFSANVKRNSVNRAVQHRIDASGKGINVTRVLTQLGVPSVHVTHLGQSCAGLFIELCRKDSIILDYVKTAGAIRYCFTIIDQDVTELVEEGEAVIGNTERHILKKVDSYLKKSRTKPSCLVISGSKAPGFSENLYPSLVYDCLSRNIPVIADYRGPDLMLTLEAIQSLKEHAKLLTIKPNAAELCSTFACTNSEEEIKDCIKQIHEKYGCSCVITQAEKPVLVHTINGFSSYNVTSVEDKQNTTGCGDAFTAGLASILCNGESFDKAVKTALLCGAKNARTIRPGSIL